MYLTILSISSEQVSFQVWLTVILRLEQRSQPDIFGTNPYSVLHDMLGEQPGLDCLTKGLFEFYHAWMYDVAQHLLCGVRQSNPICAHAARTAGEETYGKKPCDSELAHPVIG